MVAAPAVQEAVKTEVSFRNDAIKVADRKDKDDAKVALASFHT